jgi:hypothetical protein
LRRHDAAIGLWIDAIALGRKAKALDVAKRLIVLCVLTLSSLVILSIHDFSFARTTPTSHDFGAYALHKITFKHPMSPCHLLSCFDPYAFLISSLHSSCATPELQPCEAA